MAHQHDWVAIMYTAWQCHVHVHVPQSQTHVSVCLSKQPNRLISFPQTTNDLMVNT